MLVAVGLGRLSPVQVKSILESRDPLGKQQSRVAPAHGLFLKSVLYGNIGKMQRFGGTSSSTWVTPGGSMGYICGVTGQQLVVVAAPQLQLSPKP